MSQRATLLSAVRTASATGSGADVAAAVAALDDFDARQRTAAAQSRETDLSATAVRRTLEPVPVHEHHTAATDWLGDYEAPQDYRGPMIAEASAWWAGTGRTLAREDREEFEEQARGMAYTAASKYGDQALPARRVFFEYVGYLAKTGASGLPQIDQTIDPNNQPSATPYPAQVFDNFVPDQNSFNAGAEGMNHDSQISSERAPMMQQLQQMDGSGSGFGSGPERPDQHDEDFDQSLGYAEVPLGQPGTIPSAAPGAAPSAPSAPSAGNMQPMDEGADQRQNTIRPQGSWSRPDHEGFRWRTAAAGDGDRFHAPFHVRCSAYHYPDELCRPPGEHTASVAVGYSGDLDSFARQARFLQAGEAEGRRITAAVSGDFRRVAAHHDAIITGFRAEARTGDEIAWLRGYLSSVRPVLAGSGQMCACGDPARPGKKTCAACKGKKEAARAPGSRLDFPFAAEAASSLPQIQQVTDPDNMPDPQGDQLPPDVMFPIDPAFAAQWQTGPGGAQPKSMKAAAVLARSRSTWTAGDFRVVADFMSRPLHSTDDLAAPYNSAQTTPQPFSSNQQGGDFQQGMKEGQQDRASGEKPTFSDNSSRVSPYVSGYAQGYFGGPAGGGTPDMPGSLGGDSGQAQNAGEAAQSWQVAQASRRTAAAPVSMGPHNTHGHCENCGSCNTLEHHPLCSKAHESENWQYAASLRRQGRDFSQAEREEAEASGDTVPGTTKLPIKNRQDLENAERLKGKVKGVSPAKVDAYMERKEHEFGKAASIRVSAAFVTGEARGNPDFRKGYGFAQRWRRGQRLAGQGSPAFEAGIYAGICDRPAVQGAWVAAHARLAAKHPVLRSRMAAHVSFTRKLTYADLRYARKGAYPVLKRQGATSTDLITDGPGTSPDPMGSTPLNGPGTPPPMAGGEDPARSGGAPPYQQVDPVGPGPVAPDDVMGQPQQAPQHSGPFTQTFSGRHPENATLAPVAPNDAAGRGYMDSEAYQGDPQRYQMQAAFRARVQASLRQRAGQPA